MNSVVSQILGRTERWTEDSIHMRRNRNSQEIRVPHSSESQLKERSGWHVYTLTLS